MTFSIGGNNFNKRKKITINNNSGGALTAFQIEVIVTYATAMQADFDDVRFAYPNGSDIVYWLQEKTDNDHAHMWIKVELPNYGASPIGDNFIYMYYGNSTLSSANNGTNVFLFFDDFSDNNYTSSPTWTVVSGTWSAASGYLTETAAGGWNSINTSFALDSGVWEFDMKAGGDSALFKFIDVAGNGIASAGYSIYFSGVSNTDLYEIPSGTTHVFWSRVDNNAHAIKITKNASGLMEVFDRGVSKGSATDTTHTGSAYLSCHTYQTGSTFDNIRVRKYTATEPTVSIGQEEHPRKGNIIIF